MGHDARVAVVIEPSGRPHPFVRVLERAGVPVHVLEVERRGYRAERRWVARVLAETRADVLHTHGYRVDAVDAPVARRMGIPTVSTVHGFTSMGWKGRFYEWIQLLALRRMDAVVAVSDPLHELLARHGVRRSRLTTLVNAWGGGGSAVSRADARARLGLPAEGPLVGWVGRLTPEKGADVFVDAAARLPVPCAIVGGGRERDALEVRARSAGAGDRVRFLGEVAGAGDLLSAFDVLAISSRTEGTPLILFEAMGAGVPVVATRVGGIPDVVGPQEALLVPSEDTDALADALLQCVQDPESARTRAQAARRRLDERYAAEPWLGAHLDLYRKLLARA